MKKILYGILRKIEIFRKMETYLKNSRATQLEILNGMIFNNTIVDSTWFKYRSVSPGLWAADYGLLYSIFRILNEMKPMNILEFGLGQSSKLIHQYAQFYHVKAKTCEHDEKWIHFFMQSKPGDYNVTIEKMDLETIQYKGLETLTYKSCPNLFQDEKYDFILVDGPFGSRHYSRPQIIDIVKNNLSASFCIVIDDTHRNGEMETVHEIEAIFRERRVKYKIRQYCSSKKHTILCSDDLAFLTTM